MNRKMALIGIAFILAASAAYIAESSATMQHSTPASFLSSSIPFQYLYKYWKVEDFTAFAIGALSLAYGIIA
ncbi:MAG: hypothetical protein ACREBH_02270 [Candidatus Micrarchaeaceae archaeon]